MLVLSTLVWGLSFAPAREVGEISNASLGLTSSAIGPVLSLGLRFLLAAIIWFGIVGLIRIVRGKKSQSIQDSIENASIQNSSNLSNESNQSNDSIRSIPISPISPISKRRATNLSIGVGLLLAIGIMVQHIALDLLPVDRAESVAAFLTSLTVITVPLLVWIIWRDRPTLSLAVAIVLAVIGVWLMTRPGAASASTSSKSIAIWGIAFGIVCAIVFAGHIIAVNAVAPRVSPSRLNGVQFIVVGIVCLIVALIMMMLTNRWPSWPVEKLDRWLLNTMLLIAGPTILSYAIMAIYQPRVSPVRAAIIYMLEPVFATIFAWMWASKALEQIAIIGAALILMANVVAEIGPRFTRQKFSKS
ncbi:MAG TPA: DMT family transporter [Tepidisphaeraceae bacterium]|nr:DMT family transporter [Tepidisphaeraceae bacterium]